jgi:hypothetical protein
MDRQPEPDNSGVKISAREAEMVAREVTDFIGSAEWPRAAQEATGATLCHQARWQCRGFPELWL